MSLKRIKFHKNGDKLSSVKIFSNGEKMVRLVIDTQKMEYYLLDPVTGHLHESGGNVTNLEVLQRKAKKAIKKLLKIEFVKETRNVVRK